MLELNEVRAGYRRGVEVLSGASLQVDKGEVVCIIGPNGAGKSTVLRTISGLLHPTAGQILFKGQEIAHLPAHTIVRLGICQVPQERSAIPYMSVQENLELGGYTLEDKTLLPPRIARIYDMFPALAEKRRDKAGRLSGGQQRMLEVGRALVLEPELLLLDEPTMGLAPLISRLIFEKVGELARSGLTILMVEQNARLGLSIADRGYVMEQGRVRFEGAAATLLDSPKIAQLYLGGSTETGPAGVAEAIGYEEES